MAKESEQKLRVELSCVNLVQTIPRELDKLHWIGEGMLTKLDIIFKALSILKCFARPGTVGGHFRNIRKWRPSEYFSVLSVFSFNKLAQTQKSVLNMASSDSQIDRPQRGRPKRAELPDVNINTGAQSINTGLLLIDLPLTGECHFSPNQLFGACGCLPAAWSDDQP